MQYELRTRDGRPIVILEAADSVDAELYAARNNYLTNGWDGELRSPSRIEATSNAAGLFRTFRELGLSERGAAAAALGRDGVTSLDGPPVINVPRQEAQLSEANAGGSQTVELSEAMGSLADGLGLTESAREAFVRGRD